jgi:energy-coupling factor transporter transmembrane protein EcfT
MGALRRTDGLAMALDARGFQLDGDRVTYLHYPLGPRDAAALTGAATLVAVFVWLWSSGQLAPV